MSDACPHRGCVWEMPADTPDILTLYVADMHRAYDCPQLAAAPAHEAPSSERAPTTAHRTPTGRVGSTARVLPLAGRHHPPPNEGSPNEQRTKN